MKKNRVFNKNDLINILVLTFIFIVIIVLTLRNELIWGSELDWIDQHSVIPEYFRTLFYDTHNLLPNLALNLGSGQNIYNFAYYGLLNPIIMLSYLLPFISMRDYVIYSTILLVYSSVILFYYFLRSNKYNEKVSFLTALSFLTASPLLFHSHRHIMFINYMPFLILALIGVDKYFEKDNKILLIFSILMIILMSFYYSISSIICIVVYGIYKYLSINKKITFKSFMKDGFKFILPIFIAVLISSVLILPEMYAIYAGRMGISVKLTIFDLLIPNINITYLLYNPYGVGLTCISVVALVSLFFNKKKENRFLFTILTLLIIFPIFIYVINGFMYADSKALIPFLPLYSLVISIFIDNYFKNKIEINKVVIITIIIAILCYILKTYKSVYLFYEIALTLIVIFITYKRKYHEVFYIYLTIIFVLFSLIANSYDKLISKDDNIYTNDIKEKELIDNITNNDKGMYRITTLVDKKHTSNSVFSNIDMYQDTIYSSIYDAGYNKFYYDVFNNPIQSRNRILTTPSDNILFLMFMGNKYLLSEEELIGYTEYEKNDSITSYVNEDVLPFMYVTNNTFSESEFNNLSFPYSNEVLLNYVVTNDGKSTKSRTNIHEFEVSKAVFKNVAVTKNIEGYTLSAKENATINIDIDEKAKNKIILIKFDMDLKQSCRKGDQAIIINGQINKLTCKEWKYYNSNTVFTYVLSNANINSLNIELFEGNYVISDIKLYYLDYDDIKNINDKVTEVIIDKDKTKGDYIYGTINVEENDSYLVTSIPYQKGFIIYVDGKEVTYEKVNTSFIGFKIDEGMHNIVFKYTSPLKKEGIALSIVGLIGLIIIIIRSRSSKNERKYRTIK